MDLYTTRILLLIKTTISFWFDGLVVSTNFIWNHYIDCSRYADLILIIYGTKLWPIANLKHKILRCSDIGTKNIDLDIQIE